MKPACNITQKMDGLTIKPKAPVSTPNHTIMESTHEITQEMEDMTLNPKARVDTPFTTTTSPHTQRVPSQQQPQPSLPAAFNFAGNSTGDYVYTTTSAGLSFSNPNASSSSSSNTTTTTTDTTNITTNTAATNLFQDQDFCDHLLNCDDPVGFLEVSLYLARFPSMSLSHNHPSSNNRITKFRSTTTSSSRERHHHAHPIRLVQPGTMTPEMGTTIYKATMKKVPGTTIYTTTAERNAAEEKEKEKERMTTAYVENCLTFTKARVAAEKAARVAREKQMQMQMRSGGSGMGGAYGEDSSWFLRGRERAKKTWVNEDGDVVEERWLEPNPMVSWSEGNEDFDGMDGVEESVEGEGEEEDGDEDDEMME
ncbi:hypothetical protein NEUTE1DRAFT_111692 [Neurospora tetrasperma FGSC 2508]|uniref:Uncharacterized protein n=1 Tax=Neurospora tetrasperma (strain FGSC 2508 / ATCC MYA-4615 / P0657) TaxID=510951 RepID=F8MSU5_NEUT8|nr:uncharacterized protein NEUTE1DRAFT_111692 [Neurospora tetrasperma FGSC 2508]EGO55128.1 hypothetical protein NEUTE1DRAFT_111692 [Neurospora tetrasperma FGSC 2508]EGZ69659.1 hypothetical protein NEUTE2DRAFT_169254 [Neurospora tetrasperma FGSC 2509]